jgi:predicted small metal-binding protein
MLRSLRERYCLLRYVHNMHRLYEGWRVEIHGSDSCGREVTTMAERLKKVECDPKCGFLIQSHEEKEIVEIAMQHAKKAHSLVITEKDVRAMLKDA